MSEWVKKESTWKNYKFVISEKLQKEIQKQKEQSVKKIVSQTGQNVKDVKNVKIDFILAVISVKITPLPLSKYVEISVVKRKRHAKLLVLLNVRAKKHLQKTNVTKITPFLNKAPFAKCSKKLPAQTNVTKDFFYKNP